MVAVVFLLSALDHELIQLVVFLELSLLVVMILLAVDGGRWILGCCSGRRCFVWTILVSMPG